MKLNAEELTKLTKIEILANTKCYLIFYSDEKLDKYDNVMSYLNVTFDNLADYNYVNIIQK